MTQEQKLELWQQHIAGWRQGQLSQRDYCKQHALSFSSFTYWRARLKRLSEGQNKLVPVQISRAAAVTIFLPAGIRMEVPVHALEDILPILRRITQGPV